MAKTSSMLIYQIVEGMRQREYTLDLLSGVTGYKKSQLVAWLFDECGPYPTIDVVERIMQTLRLVPVYVPAEEKETTIRDVLDDIELAIFDSAPDTPPEVLRYQLHDLALQRYRLEEGYANGSVPDKLYHTLLLKLAEATRFAAEALTKVEQQARQTISGEAEVEIIYKEEDATLTKSKPLEEADLADEEEVLPIVGNSVRQKEPQ